MNNRKKIALLFVVAASICLTASALNTSSNIKKLKMKINGFTIKINKKESPFKRLISIGKNNKIIGFAYSECENNFSTFYQDVSIFQSIKDPKTGKIINIVVTQKGKTLESKINLLDLMCNGKNPLPPKTIVKNLQTAELI